ncbi:MAG: hypothetical protein IJW13_00415, partial [Clostridia bacterium]|nr:hypothetical protein [Clostridia bacterium]
WRKYIAFYNFTPLKKCHIATTPIILILILTVNLSKNQVCRKLDIPLFIIRLYTTSFKNQPLFAPSPLFLHLHSNTLFTVCQYPFLKKFLPLIKNTFTYMTVLSGHFYPNF